MCGIVGMAGNFNKKMLEEALKSINHRGEDYSEIFIDEDDNINNIFEKCNRIIMSDKVTKFKLSLDEINFLIKVNEQKKKDLI